MLYKVLIGLVFCLALSELFIGGVDSQVISCYKCTDNCATNKTVQNCTVTGMSCMSSTINIPFMTNKVTKMCAPTSDCSAQNLGFMGYGLFVTCCTTDLCNAAPKLVQSVAFFLLPLLSLIFYNFNK